MLWNCPHCGVTVSAADQLLGPDWSYSRCFKCAGYSMVRKQGVHTLKLDGAPEKASVLAAGVPETIEPKNSVTIQSSTQSANPLIPPRFDLKQIQSKNQDLSSVASTIVSEPSRLKKTELDSPVSKEPDSTSQMVGSSKSQNNSSVIRSYFSFGPDARLRTKKVLLASASTITVLAIIGLNLEKNVQHSSIALLSGDSVPLSDSNSLAKTESHPLADQSSKQAINDPGAKQTVSDQLSQQAMAPQRNPSAITKDGVNNGSLINGLVVKPRLGSILRAGPGVENAIAAKASPESIYVVVDWKERWFKVSELALDGTLKPTEISTETWIRNDLVALVK